jgi:dipeptide/tripeptide permease
MIALLLMIPVNVVGSATLLYIVIILLALGDGLSSPNLSALISQGADESSQGKVQGGSKSMQSLAALLAQLALVNSTIIWDTFLGMSRERDYLH